MAVFHFLDESKKSKLTVTKGDKMDIKYGKKMVDCGNPKPCFKDEVPMYFYSGRNKDDSPKICVNGRLVIDHDLNNAGRGLNLVVLDVKTRQVLRVGHFDTYNEELIAVVSFDEAASRLSETSKKIFYELGSSLIDRIKFRASWYFVGQKGIDSFSTFEQMFIPSNNNWARPVDVSVCVPLNSLKTLHVSGPTNSARRHFCEKYDGYGDFCREDRLDIILTSRMLKNRSRSTHQVFSLPILLAAGLNRNSIRLCLETMLDQEGINMQNVVVSFDVAYPEVAHLAALFHTRSLPVENATSYNDFVFKSMLQVMELYPWSPCIIVIEEDVLLSSDFLFIIDQLLETFLMDETANIIQLFNKNGISVYRFENSSFSKAFIIKRDAFMRYIDNKVVSVLNFFLCVLLEILPCLMI
uniref:ILEI domain-containing protein n=1 Tax=Syphacia muris TaxID=451379 RepID=A0A158R682_9BILA